MNLPSSRDVLWSVGIWTLCSWGSSPGSAPLLVFPEPKGKKTKHASLIFNRSQIFLRNEVTCLLLNLLVNIFKTNIPSLICGLVEDPWSFSRCDFFLIWEILNFLWKLRTSLFAWNFASYLVSSLSLSPLGCGPPFAAPPTVPWWSPLAGPRRCPRGKWAGPGAARPARSRLTRCRCWMCSRWRQRWAPGHGSTASRYRTR